MGEMNLKGRGELICETFKQEIPDSRLKPDQVVSEDGICKRFGVSRTPVHDALRPLQEQGSAETTPYHGICVTLLSLDNVKQMIYMRVTMETMVLRDFLETQTPMAMEDIHHSITQQRAVIREPGFESGQFYHMDTQIHSIWSAAVRRRELWEMFQAQQLHYTRFGMLDSIMETDFIHTIDEHGDSFHLVADENEKGLGETLKEHLYYNMKRMHHSIEVDYKDYFEEEDEEGRFVV